MNIKGVGACKGLEVHIISPATASRVVYIEEIPTRLGQFFIIHVVQRNTATLHSTKISAWPWIADVVIDINFANYYNNACSLSPHAVHHL